MRLRIIIPSTTVLDTETELVTIPGTKGIFGVMPGHMKFTTNINKGVVTAETKNGQKKFYVHGGIAQVDNDEVNILSDFADNLSIERDVYVKDKITELNINLKDYKEDTLEAKVISNKISQFEELRKYLKHSS